MFNRQYGACRWTEASGHCHFPAAGLRRPIGNSLEHEA